MSKLLFGTREYEEAKKRYEASMEAAGFTRTMVGDSVAWTRPAVVIDDEKVVPRDETRDPPYDLDLYMHDFGQAVDDYYTLWHVTYPNTPKLVGGSAGHKAGHAAFEKALKKAMAKRIKE